MTNLIGKTLAGRYRVEESLGRGGMAEVYKVWDTQRAAYLALKFLREDLAEDKVFIRRFKREAQTLARLQHPNIVRFYGLDEDKDEALVFMLMDYIEGTTLRKEIYKSKQPFTAGRVLEVMRPVCSALHYAHAQGIVHCDVKPGNIMMDTQGGILLSDFGIARMSESATATMVGAGTPAYMAPEQIRGENPTPQTDIYALGVVLFEMLTGGERPFTGEKANTTGSTGEKLRWEQLNRKPPSPRKINPEISTDLEAVVLKCLQKEPASRQADVLELLNELSRTILSSGTIASEHPKAPSADKVLSGVKPQRSTESEQELQEQLVRADLLRAEALMEMGKPDQAIQELQEAYKVKKDLVAEPLTAALRDRGNMKAAQGKIEAAQSDYRQALEVAPPGQLRDDLLTKINGLKALVSGGLRCPTCGKPIEPEWVACPYCKSRLILSTPKAVPVNVQTAQLSAIWIGYVFILALSGLAVLQTLGLYWGLGVSSFSASLMVILGIVAFIYWFICLYQVHKVLQKLTSFSYPISPWRSVGLHFLPIYNFYWMFKWSNELMDMIQDKRKGALKKGGMGILLLTGFIFIGIAYSVVTSSALSGLLLLAFGLLLIFSVLEFLSNEMMVTFGNAVQENRGSQWTARIGQFVDKYSLIFWMVASSSVVLLTFLQISNGFPIWLFVAMGLFQQIILKSRKLVAIWWALCWILGLISGFLAMLLLVWLFPSLNSSSSLSSIMVCVLIGVFSGIYQWLILRKNQVKAARWWILVSAISGLVFAPTFNSGSNFYLPALLALGYSVVTGLSMEWLLKHQVESSLNLGKFLIRMPLWTKVITAAALILIIFFSIEIWETRKLSDFPFSVSSASSWADTGLSLEPGNRVEIQYLSGQWSIDPTNSEDGKYTDANGVQYSTPSKWCLGCGAPDPAGTLGMLYATLSPATGNNVAVGDYSSFTVQQAGDLYLMINDSYGNLADNSGSIIVQIRVYNR